jgi:hypothetical protein
MGRRYDTIDDLRKRKTAWERELGTRSQFANMAPQIIAALDLEIRALEQKETGND